MTTFLYPLSGSGIFWDWSSRLRQNDTTLQFHHFFWTTFTYLGPFFLIQTYSTTTALFPRHRLIILTPLLVYLVEVQDYLFVNLYYGEISNNYWSFNLLLTNNLNKYHPHLFYASTWSLLLLLIYQRYNAYLQTPTFILTESIKKVRELTYFTGLLNSFALFLGSWWAFQEGTWGGWWNWDPSEVLGLLVLLITLLISHKVQNYLSTWSLLQKTFVGVILFLWVYFFTQLNFDLVSHNFGNRFTFFFVNTLFYLDMLVLLTLNLILFGLVNLRLVRSLKLSRIANECFKGNLVWLPTLTITWALLVLGSFHPLFNYFLWQYFSVNFWNFTPNYEIFYYTIILLLYGVFVVKPLRKSQGVIPTLTFFTCTPLSTVLPLIGFPEKGWKTLHLLLTLTLVLNVLDNQTHVVLLSYESSLLKTTISYTESGFMFEVWSLEDFWKEKTRISWYRNSSTTTHSFLAKHSACEVNQFNFSQSQTCFMTTTLAPLSDYSLKRNYLHIFFNSFYELIFVIFFLFWVRQSKTS